MGYPQGLGHSVSRECKVCCLGGPYHVSNTLHVRTTPQEHCSTILIYDQGHNAEVLGKTVVLLGFRTSCVVKI